MFSYIGSSVVNLFISRTLPDNSSYKCSSVVSSMSTLFVDVGSKTQNAYREIPGKILHHQTGSPILKRLDDLYFYILPV